jgi:hypothetical protein
MHSGETSIRKNYAFSKTEYEKVLELFSIIQKELTSAGNLPHKTRLKLFEKLEQLIVYFEIRLDNLDLLWSFIAMTEIAFKIYERTRIPESLKELTNTVWLVQCRVEGRPLNSTPPITF